MKKKDVIMFNKEESFNLHNFLNDAIVICTGVFVIFSAVCLALIH